MLEHNTTKGLHIFEEEESAVKEAPLGTPILIVLRSEDRGMTVDHHPRAEVIRYLARKEDGTVLTTQLGMVSLKNTSYVDWSKSEDKLVKYEGTLCTSKFMSDLAHRPIDEITVPSGCFGNAWHDRELTYPELEIVVGERKIVEWCKKHPMRAIALWKACETLGIRAPAWKPLQDEVTRRRDEALKSYKEFRKKLQEASKGMKDMRLRAHYYGARVEDFE